MGWLLIHQLTTDDTSIVFCFMSSVFVFPGKPRVVTTISLSHLQHIVYFKIPLKNISFKKISYSDSLFTIFLRGKGIILFDLGHGKLLISVLWSCVWVVLDFCLVICGMINKFFKKLNFTSIHGFIVLHVFETMWALWLNIFILGKISHLVLNCWINVCIMKIQKSKVKNSSSEIVSLLCPPWFYHIMIKMITSVSACKL